MGLSHSYTLPPEALEVPRASGKEQGMTAPPKTGSSQAASKVSVLVIFKSTERNDHSTQRTVSVLARMAF